MRQPLLVVAVVAVLSSICFRVDADDGESSGEGIEASGFAEDNIDSSQIAVENDKQFFTSSERDILAHIQVPLDVDNDISTDLLTTSDNEYINKIDKSLSLMESGQVKKPAMAGENPTPVRSTHTTVFHIPTMNSTESPSSNNVTIHAPLTTERAGITTAPLIILPEAVTVRGLKSKTEKPVSVVCNKLTVCYKDEECGRGRCMGAFVGKCNCNACVNFRACDSDVQCGGLEGACNMMIRKCKCADVYAKHGMELYIDVLTQFCNNKPCTGRQDCYGQPCNPGRCYC